MKKHHREIIKAVRQMAPKAVLEMLPVTGHAQMVVTVDGRAERFIVSNTPQRPEITVRNVIKEIARTFNLTPTTRL